MFHGESFSASRMEAETPSKIDAHAEELRSRIPEKNLPGIISDLRRYLLLRRLNDTSPNDWHGETRDSFGDLGVGSSPMDSFIEGVSEFDAWDDLQDVYGQEPDQPPKWTVEEIRDLIDKLEKGA